MNSGPSVEYTIDAGSLRSETPESVTQIPGTPTEDRRLFAAFCSAFLGTHEGDDDDDATTVFADDASREAFTDADVTALMRSPRPTQLSPRRTISPDPTSAKRARRARPEAPLTPQTPNPATDCVLCAGDAHWRRGGVLCARHDATINPPRGQLRRSTPSQRWPPRQVPETP